MSTRAKMKEYFAEADKQNHYGPGDASEIGTTPAQTAIGFYWDCFRRFLGWGMSEADAHTEATYEREKWESYKTKPRQPRRSR